MKTLFLASAFAASLWAGAAAAEPFTILIYETPDDIALRLDTGSAGQAYWAEYSAYAEVLQASGAIRGGAALTQAVDGDHSAISAAADGRPLLLGGYFIVDVADARTASALAEQAPPVRRGGAVEVRGAYPAPTMSK